MGAQQSAVTKFANVQRWSLETLSFLNKSNGHKYSQWSFLADEMISS
jgi:hypothetical protein